MGVFGVFFGGLAFGLTYQQDIGVSFTFNPTLKITLSGTECGSTATEAKLCINNLSPGTAADSNVITVNVLNNTGNGYTLNASVGNNTTFNTRDLVHEDTTITQKFTSIATDASLTANTELGDSAWGYAFMDETLSSPAWSNYSGLPIYSDATPAVLKESFSPASSSNGDNIKFKIAAKSSNAQAPGEYSNIINFTVTARPLPVTLSMAYENAGKEKHNGYFKLQDMSSEICNAAEVLDEDSQMQAIDIRDDKVYWITKLRDGKCWMTQNLDHDISTTFAYTPDNTDIPANWTPTRATINASSVTNNSISGWSEDNNTPYSVDPGNVYWNAFPFYDSTANNFMADNWGSNPVKFQRNTSFSTNGEHGHVGNYYNWSAAVAMNNTSSYTSSTLANPTANPQTSICPKGWRLPTISNADYTTNGTTNEFARLTNIYANYTGSASLSSENLEKAPLYFVRSGFVYSSRQNNAGNYGYYWSSSVYHSANAYHLNFRSGNVNPTSGSSRFNGLSVRCVAR